MSFDKICLKGITAKGYHGFYDKEKAVGQNFVVDVVMDVDSKNACIKDDLAKTVDYSKVGSAVVQVIESDPVNLIETLAEKIASKVLEFENVCEVSVTVHKPEAPLDYEFKDIEFTIERNRSNLRFDFKDDLKNAQKPLSLSENIVENENINKNKDNDFSINTEADSVASEDKFNILHAENECKCSNEAISNDKCEDEHSDENMTVETDPKTDIIDVTKSGCENFPPIFNPDKADVILALGANLGDPVEMFKNVISDLDRALGFEVTDVSPLVKNKAQTLNSEVQDDYFNCVLAGKTFLSQQDLLGLVKEIECYFGRRAHSKWESRTIDIDIISYNNESYHSENLTIPHKMAKDRCFVLLPWYLMDKSAVLGEQKVFDLLKGVDCKNNVIFVWNDWLTKSLSELEDISAMNMNTGVECDNLERRIIDDDVDIFTGKDIESDGSIIGNCEFLSNDENDDDIENNVNLSSADENVISVPGNESRIIDFASSKDELEEKCSVQADSAIPSDDCVCADSLEDKDFSSEIAANDQVEKNDLDQEDNLNDILNSLEHTRVMNQLRTLFTGGAEENVADNFVTEKNANEIKTGENSDSHSANIAGDVNYQDSMVQIEKSDVKKHENFSNENERDGEFGRGLKKHTGIYEGDLPNEWDNKVSRKSIYEALRKKTFEEAMDTDFSNPNHSYKPKWQSIDMGN